MKLQVKRLSEDAFLPTRAKADDAAYDLYASEDITLLTMTVTPVPTGIAIQLPEIEEGIGVYARIAPRSGLAAKHSLDVYGGVVDAGYRGEIKALLYNGGKTKYDVKKGDRIAQMIITPIVTPDVEEVKDLDKSDRGKGGFGSTGK